VVEATIVNSAEMWNRLDIEKQVNGCYEWQITVAQVNIGQ
jgi:hypothetical protein